MKIRRRGAGSRGFGVLLGVVFLSATVLGTTQPAFAHEIEVYDVYVATTGTASGSCTYQMPCSTVSAAMRRISNGGTIHVAPGWYPERPAIPAGMTYSIQGAGEYATVLYGQSGGSTLTVPEQASLAVSDLAVVGGQSLTGAGIYNAGVLRLTRVDVAFNTATGIGGGLFNSGQLTVVGSTIAYNQARHGGGGVAAFGPVDITGSLITKNALTQGVQPQGAGVFALDTTVTMADTTITENDAQDGQGGAIYLRDSTLTATHLTVNHNNAAVGGGLLLWPSNETLAGSVIADNSGGNCANVDGAFRVSSRFNLDTDGSCLPPQYLGTPASGPLVGVGPKLGPVQDNGGPSNTEAPATDSPAHNAIPADDHLCDGTDQRGVLRRTNAPGCDMGAYQLP